MVTLSVYRGVKISPLPVELRVTRTRFEVPAATKIIPPLALVDSMSPFTFNFPVPTTGAAPAPDPVLMPIPTLPVEATTNRLVVSVGVPGSRYTKEPLIEIVP